MFIQELLYFVNVKYQPAVFVHERHWIRELDEMLLAQIKNAVA